MRNKHPIMQEVKNPAGHLFKRRRIIYHFIGNTSECRNMTGNGHTRIDHRMKFTFDSAPLCNTMAISVIPLEIAWPPVVSISTIAYMNRDVEIKNKKRKNC